MTTELSFSKVFAAPGQIKSKGKFTSVAQDVRQAHGLAFEGAQPAFMLVCLHNKVPVYDSKTDTWEREDRRFVAIIPNEFDISSFEARKKLTDEIVAKAQQLIPPSKQLQECTFAIWPAMDKRGRSQDIGCNYHPIIQINPAKLAVGEIRQTLSLTKPTVIELATPT